MAHGAKYYADLAGTHRVSLLQEGFAGEPTELSLVGQEGARSTGGAGIVHPTDRPLTVTWGRRGIDLFTPVLASYAEAEFWRVGDTPLLEELASARPGEWRLLIERRLGAGGLIDRSAPLVEYWQGDVEADVYDDETMRRPHRVQVRATDGLGGLKEQPFLASQTFQRFDPDAGGNQPPPTINRTPYQGGYLAYLLREALAKTGYQRELVTLADWHPFPLYDSDFSEGPRFVDPFRYISLDVRDLFYEYPETAASEEERQAGVRAATCYHVLKQLLYAFGAQLYTHSGRWFVRSRPTLARTVASATEQAGEATQYVYAPGFDFEGRAVGQTEPVPAALALDLSQHARLDGGRSNRQPFRSTSITFAHGLPPDILRNGGFEETRPTIPGGTSSLGTPVWKRKIGSQPEPFYVNRGSNAAPNWVARIRGFEHMSGISRPSTVAAVVTDEGAHLQEGAGIFEGDLLSLHLECRLERFQGEAKTFFQTYWSLELGHLGDQGDFVPEFRARLSEPDDAGEYQSADWEPVNDTFPRHALINYAVAPGTNGDGDLEWGRRGLTLGQWNTIEASFPETPDADARAANGYEADPDAPERERRQYRWRLTLYGTSDGPGGDLKVAFVDWDNISLQRTDSEGGRVKATQWVATQDAPGSDKEDLQIEVSGTPYDIPHNLGTDWRVGRPYESGDAPTGKAHAALVAEAHLKAQLRHLETRIERYRGLRDDLEYEPGRVLRGPVEEGGKAFLPVYVQKDLYRDEVEAQLVELIHDDALEPAEEERASEAAPGELPTRREDAGGPARRQEEALRDQSQDLTALEGRTDALEDRATTLEAEQAQQRTELDAARADLDVAEDDVLALEQTAVDHEQRLAALEDGSAGSVRWDQIEGIPDLLKRLTEMLQLRAGGNIYNIPAELAGVYEEGDPEFGAGTGGRWHAAQEKAAPSFAPRSYVASEEEAATSFVTIEN